jgi:tRNA1(Val) A37 N6-methylase TrmN6
MTENKTEFPVHRRSGQVSERSFYPGLLDVIREKGGSGVQEVQYNSVPDIQFDMLGGPWLLSVKLGETLTIIKDAFLQYLRHKEESGIGRGLLLILPEALRKLPAQDEALRQAIATSPVTVLVDAGPVKAEYRDVPFPQVLDRLTVEIARLLEGGVERHFPLKLVLDLLREQLVEMMEGLALQERQVLRLVTDWRLLTELAKVERKQARDAARFLAAYVFLSQVLFLRLFSSVHPRIIPGRGVITRFRLKQAFQRILHINYRPIFELNVLDAIPEKFLRDTFTLIWGMEVERVRYELPGRLFHELMPSQIRKLLAAFYTRPQAAELLARLSVDKSSATIIDPACGSGTILTAAYRRKKRLHDEEGLRENPHRRYCEHDIYGADLMPFAVHLTCANLAAMDVAETIERTQVLQGDSIEITPAKVYRGGVFQLDLFSKPLAARKTSGQQYRVVVPKSGLNAVLMNPPFTKTERRIADYVNMKKFKDQAGGEVGLWGHFVFLADTLLASNGTYGAVLPINVLRGRESARVREFLFKEWTPVYIVKSTRSYAFSESAEYRDILFVAKKRKPRRGQKIKVCFVKKNLTLLSAEDIELLSQRIESRAQLRSSELDIDAHPIEDFLARFPNMMWFCGTEDLAHRDLLVRFCEQFKDKLHKFPPGYFREGYRPVPKGVSQVLFVTRASHPGRVEECFMRFERENDQHVEATTELGSHWSIDKQDLLPSIRTPVGLRRMDVTRLTDYIAQHPYRHLHEVRRAAGYRGGIPAKFWEHLRKELQSTRTSLVVARRLDYGSPSFHLIAWHSQESFSPSNQVTVIKESDPETAKAVCVMLNSAIFLSNFFLLKEQSHARYADIRFYDLDEMTLYPPPQLRGRLSAIFEKYSNIDFPPLREQLDSQFDDRYSEYWESQREGAKQTRFWRVLGNPVSPSTTRLAFDEEVCAVLGLRVTSDDLVKVYGVIAQEVIITRRLARD